MSLITIAKAGVPGIILGLITVLSTGVLTYFIYSAIRRKPDPMGMAIGTVGGNAVATPASVAAVDTSLEPYAASATAQIAASVVITAILTPVLTGFVARRSQKKLQKNAADPTSCGLKKTHTKGCRPQTNKKSCKNRI